MSCWDRGPPVEKFSSKWGGGSAQRNQGQEGQENLLLRELRDLKLTRKLPPASVGLTKDKKRHFLPPIQPKPGSVPGETA